MSNKFDNQINLWWKYVDLLILKLLSSPLPIDVWPSFQPTGSGRTLKTKPHIHLFNYSAKYDDRAMNRIRIFLIPQSSLVSIDDIMQFENNEEEEGDTGLYAVTGHVEDMHDADRVMNRATDLGLNYLSDIKAKFPELSSFKQYSEDITSMEDIQIYRAVLDAMDNNEVCDFLGKNIGNAVIRDIRSSNITDIMLRLYDALGLTSLTVRADIYFKGADAVRNERLVTANAIEKESIECYGDLYDIYENFIHEYVLAMRPYVHTRIQKGVIIDNISKPNMERFFKIFEPSSDQTFTGFGSRAEDYSQSNAIEERLQHEIQKLEMIDDDTTDRRAGIYYPWGNIFVRFDTKEGDNGNECYNR